MGPDPETDPDAWDAAQIGGEPTPGLVEISKGGRILKFDSAKGHGTLGATTKFVGDDLSTFTMKIRFFPGVGGLSGPEQRARWFSVHVPILKKAETGKFAIDFYHPAVSEEPINVRSVVPENIGQLEREDDVWTVSVDFKQFRKSKPAPAGKPASSAASKNPQPTAQDAADKEIQSLVQQIKDLAA